MSQRHAPPSALPRSRSTRLLGAHLLALMLTGGLASGCSGDEGDGAPDLPAGFEGATALTLMQSECKGDAPGAGVEPDLQLTRVNDALAAVFEDAQFRCQQVVCGYRSDAGGKVRVLMQPCDMNPASVPKCDCIFKIEFPLTDVDAGSVVELYRRSDRYGASGDPPATLVDSATAP